jgi:hypothetical protein
MRELQLPQTHRKKQANFKLGNFGAGFVAYFTAFTPTTPNQSVIGPTSPSASTKNEIAGFINF